MSISHSRFAVSPKSTPAVASVGVPLGTVFRLRLSEAASVTFSIARKTTGRKVKTGHPKRTKCVAPGRARVNARSRCTLYLPAGTLRRSLRAGPASVTFTGRIDRKALRPGAYRLTIQATTKNRHRSRPITLTFTIIR